MHRESMKKKRRELEQGSMDAASDLLDTDSNTTFAMVWFSLFLFYFIFLLLLLCSRATVKLSLMRMCLRLRLFLEAVSSSPGRSVGTRKTASMRSAYGTTKTTKLLPNVAIKVPNQVHIYLHTNRIFCYRFRCVFSLSFLWLFMSS